MVIRSRRDRGAAAAAAGGVSALSALRASACAQVDATPLMLTPRERHRRRSSVFGVGAHEGPRPHLTSVLDVLGDCGSVLAGAGAAEPASFYFFLPVRSSATSAFSLRMNN